ncbi:MAG: AAA family ATPase [Pseudohongiellaceae bacterium]
MVGRLPYNIQFAGSFELKVHGTRVACRPFQKELSLLLLLVLEPDLEHSRISLGRFLWPQVSAQGQSNNLRQILSRLRNLLSDDGSVAGALQITNRTVALRTDADVSTDLWSIDELLNDQNGPVSLISDYPTHRFRNYSVKNCPDFNTHLKNRITLFELKLSKFLEQWLERHIDLAEFKTVELICRQLLLLDPENQSSYLRLLRLNIQQNRKNEAKSVFQQAVNKFPDFSSQLGQREHGFLSLDIDESTASRNVRQLPMSFLWIGYSHETFAADTQVLFKMLEKVESWFRKQKFNVISQITGEMLIYHTEAALQDRATGNILLEWWSLLQDFPDAKDLVVLLFGGNVKASTTLESQSVMLLSHEASTIISGNQLRRGIWITKLCQQRLQRLHSLQIEYKKHGTLHEVLDIAQSPLITQWEHASACTPLIGRTSEMERLKNCWRNVMGGGAHATLIQGDPGIGKSRLIAEFRDFVEIGGGKTHALQCHQHQAEPFSVFIDWIKRELLPKNANRKSTYLIDTFDFSAERGVFVDYLLHNISKPVEKLAKLPAAYLHKELVESLLELIRVTSTPNAATILTVEDLHWIDDASLSVLQQLCMNSPQRIMILMSARPEFKCETLQAETIELPSLNASETSSLIRSIVPDELGESPLLETAVFRADGNPLYAEELAAIINSPDTSIDVPESLIELLVYRINSLGEISIIATTAAVIGREFDLNTLAVLLEADEIALNNKLQKICATGLLEARKEHRYLFKHYLIFQAAYNMLAIETRQALHRKLAILLEKSSLKPSQYRLLDMHWVAGGDPVKAVKYRRLHSQRLIALSSYQEAYEYNRLTLDYFDDGIVDDVEGHIHCLEMQGHLTMMLKGYGNEDIVKHSESGIKLAKSIGDYRAEYFSHLALWFTSSSRQGHFAAVKEGHELLDIANRLDDLSMQMQAHYCLGNGHFFMGKMDEAEKAFQWVLSRSSNDYDNQVDLFGEHAVVVSQSFLAWIEQFKYNNLDKALLRLEEAILMAEEVDHSYSLAFAHGFRVMLLAWADRHDLLEKYLPIQKKLADEYHFAFWQTAGSIVEELGLIIKGESNSLDRLNAGIETIKIVIPGHYITFASFQIKAQAALQQWQLLDQSIEGLIEIAEQKMDRCQLAEMYYQRSLIPMYKEKQQAIELARFWAHESGAPHVLQRLGDIAV